MLGVRSRARRARLLLAGLALATLLSAVVCIGIGPVPIAPGTVLQVIAAHLRLDGVPFVGPLVGAVVGPLVGPLLDGGAGASAGVPVDAATDTIVWSVRVPRVLLGAAVGACLAISGATLQAMVRTMLADPYVLGISGGASTGAAAAILFGVGAALGEAAQSVLAFVGALGAALLVLVLARANGRVTSMRLLLSGIAVGYALSAATSLLIFSSDSAEGSRSVMFWMLGSLSLARWNAFLGIALAAAILGTAVLIGGGRVLDALGAGDETAHGLGISPDRARIALLVAVSLCTAAAVAAAGSIGFVGLVIPHLARRLVGTRHRVLIPASALLGALLLLWADVVARMVMQPRELPIGVLTAAVGAPFLLILIRRLHAHSG
ncbi:FecCD family ABC transporter permease [Brachybacterium sp. DNPG3]